MNDDAVDFDTRAGWHAALLAGVVDAPAHGVRELVAVDADFADWPLDDPALLRALTDWLKRPQRRLVLLAARFDGVPLRHPRFTAWRRDWAHAVPAWQAAGDMAAELPSVLLDDAGLCVQRRVDSRRCEGRTQRDRRLAHAVRGEVDVFLQRSEPAFAANTLGL